ncbi:carbohydrate kinase family protein [Ostreibacterium oceani]|uniref:Carbohydrate kinase family protein n=1 Tax=Ostreibacterium oceani TaxID=2654998 RepID=A0A6N7EZ49_9GAMM|nr:carbohydrate kinase family protein [Ostreibacterium oceani]MPV86639.1 carbohydrate kinase family protein [Ostreibacterium oceani]
MQIAVCGSIAYDYILRFEGRFAESLLPEKMHELSVSFYTPEMRKEFGGTAGNIAYAMQLLGLSPIIFATVGSDFSPYHAHLTRLNLNTRGIVNVPNEYCAQCFLTTDIAGNQINSFHPGAMVHAADNSVFANDWRLAIISPDAPDAMLAHSARLQSLGVPYIFDPGQALPVLDKAAIEQLISGASYLICNDYESALLSEKIARPIQSLVSTTTAIIITQGDQGSRIYHDNQITTIPVATVTQPLDPTGCGDAYRAGLIYGILHGFDWHTTGKMAALCAAYQVEQHGTQNYDFSLPDFKRRLETAFG